MKSIKIILIVFCILCVPAFGFITISTTIAEKAFRYCGNTQEAQVEEFCNEFVKRVTANPEIPLEMKLFMFDDEFAKFFIPKVEKLIDDVHHGKHSFLTFMLGGKKIGEEVVTFYLQSNNQTSEQMSSITS